MKLLPCYALFWRHQWHLETSTRICFLLGQQPVNPLLLLGQYSDDDLEEESSKGADHAVVSSSSPDSDNQTKVDVDKESVDIGINANKDLSAQKVEQHNLENASASLECLQKLEENGIEGNDATDLSNLRAEIGLTEQTSVPETSGTQVNGDVGSGWKMVLHEESNQYYYWNTYTGETSWEVPDVLTSESKGAGINEEGQNAVAAQHMYGSNVANPSCKTEEILECSPNMEVSIDGNTSEIPDYDNKRGHSVDQIDENNNLGTVSSLSNETSPGKIIDSSHSDDALLANGCPAHADSEKYTHNVRDSAEHESTRDLCFRLLRHGEYLLERLNTLKGSKGRRLIGHDQISKYILEVEIRLGDIKSLLSHGSSLLTFWLHSERQLKQLESAISDEVLQFYESVEMNDLGGTHKSHERIGDDGKADVKMEVCSASEDSYYACRAAEVLEVSLNEASTCTTVQNDQFTSVESLNALTDSAPGGKDEVLEVTVPAESTQTIHAGEDVDMDVEMELEDAIPVSDTTNQAEASQYYPPPEQQHIWPNPPTEYEPFMSDVGVGVGVPPPPDDNWIPPPPPDNEPFPPPPPDEPPEDTYPTPPSDQVIMPSFSYAAEQYSLTYQGSSVAYYGESNIEVPENNIYAAGACSLAIPIQPYYYEAVPNTYPGAAPVLTNPVEPLSYYGHQEETVPPVPGVSNVESFSLHTASVHEGLGSDKTVSVEASTEVGCTSLSNAGVDVSTISRETEKASVDVPFAPISDRVPATISVTLGNLVSSTPAITTAVTATVPKVQPKVPRNKKRTAAVVSTLRSNKKVSGLVDKWKAAKEELHEEEEDEPENAYEILEKKRRREIEEWRAQQIASGEAKDNANFQPLGGDWRERVKRKRAHLMSESAHATPKLSTNGGTQPDLDEISKGLPSGWQAYWDESSKQVYYGNSASSETTWIRPTN